MTHATTSSLRRHLVGQAGEWFVTAELLRRGWRVHERHARWPGHDLLVRSRGGTRECRIEVKAVASHPSTYAHSLRNKDCDVLVLVSNVRAKSAAEASSLGRFGSAAMPRFFVIPFVDVRRLVRGSRLTLDRAAQRRYEDRWEFLEMAPERDADTRAQMRDLAAPYFVAAHLSRSGYACVLTTELGGGVPSVQFYLDSASPSGPDEFYLSWAARRARSRGESVLVSADVRPWSKTVQLLSLDSSRAHGRGQAFAPATHDGLLAFVDMRRPYKRFAVLTREYLRRSRRSCRTWPLEELLRRSALARSAWAA